MAGGRMRRTVEDTLVIWAIAAPMSVSGSKYTLSIPIPDRDCDSMRLIPFTVVDMARSLMMTTRRSMSSALRPGYDQTMMTTGMSITGKMSRRIFCTENAPKMMRSAAATAMVYGRRSASRTIHMVASGKMTRAVRKLHCGC